MTESRAQTLLAQVSNALPRVSGALASGHLEETADELLVSIHLLTSIRSAILKDKVEY